MRLLRGWTGQSARNRGDVRVANSWFSELGMTLLMGLMVAAPSSFAGSPDGLPVLPKRAASVAGFVPPGWVVEQQMSGNFNRDGRADALILLRMAPTAAKPGQVGTNDVAGVAGTPGVSDDNGTVRLSTPRVLVVLLGARNGYELSASNGRLVPRVDLVSQDDPMANGELSVRPGGFDINLGITAAVGSYLGAAVHYRVRHQNGCFRLIGYDRLETHRATLATQDLSINFLTGAVVHTTGNAQSDATQVRREQLTANPRRCLQDLDSAVDFKPF